MDVSYSNVHATLSSLVFYLKVSGIICLLFSSNQGYPQKRLFIFQFYWKPRHLTFLTILLIISIFYHYSYHEKSLKGDKDLERYKLTNLVTDRTLECSFSWIGEFWTFLERWNSCTYTIIWLGVLDMSLWITFKVFFPKGPTCHKKIL